MISALIRCSELSDLPRCGATPACGGINSDSEDAPHYVRDKLPKAHSLGGLPAGGAGDIKSARSLDPVFSGATVAGSPA